MKVIDAINELDGKKREITQKYCDHCQEFTCDWCNEEMEGDTE